MGGNHPIKDLVGVVMILQYILTLISINFKEIVKIIKTSPKIVLNN
jgi:hypothetical protein